jgi:hypothetical protein
VSRLAADGGDLLRRLALEHEKEVARLHVEIRVLQEEVGRLTGIPLPLPREGSGRSEPSSMLRGTTEAIEKSMRAKLPRSRNERQASAPDRKESRSGKQPDENALAKALSFVDALHDDRSLMRVIASEGGGALPQAESEENIRLLKAASDIVELTRTAQHMPEGEAREFRSPRNLREPGEDSQLAPGIKLSTISPPVKAPDRMLQAPDPPNLHDEDFGEAYMASRQQLEVCNERQSVLHDDRGPPRYRSPLAQPNFDSGVIVPKPHTPTAPRTPTSARPEVSFDGHGGEVGSEEMDIPTDSRQKTVPVFLQSVSKPSQELLEMSDLCTEPSGFAADMPHASFTDFPSREDTTWRPDLQQEDSLQRGLPVEPESPELPPSEAKISASGEDWRSLLQVQGSKWRPTGDDGVSIAMYVESAPSATVVSRKVSDGPTSI